MLMLATLVALGIGLAAEQRPPDPDTSAERIVALDPRWTVSFTTAPSAPAGYDQQLAYVPLKGGELVAIDLTRGDVAWVVPFPTSSRTMLRFGCIVRLPLPFVCLR